MSKSIFLRLPVLRWHRIPHLVLLFGIVVFLWASSPTPIAFAQGSNIIQNPGFESGSLSPWLKWGYPRSTVAVQNCCDHTGSWSAYVVPNGRYVELQQNISVIPGHTYRLQAWVYTTGGMTATIAWWSNVTNSTTCDTTNSATYVPIWCDLTVPVGTTAFNVHLGASAASGSAITDDWILSDQTHYYAQGFKSGTFYGVQAKIETATPVIREPLFSYASVNVIGGGQWVETGWIKSQPNTGCIPKFSWAIQPGSAQIINSPTPTVGVAYIYTIFRTAPGAWVLQIATTGGTVLVNQNISNPGFNSGSTIQAAGEVDSVSLANDMGVSGLLSLKWADSNGIFYPWNGWQLGW